MHFAIVDFRQSQRLIGCCLSFVAQVELLVHFALVIIHWTYCQISCCLTSVLLSRGISAAYSRQILIIDLRECFARSSVRTLSDSRFSFYLNDLGLCIVSFVFFYFIVFAGVFVFCIAKTNILMIVYSSQALSEFIVTMIELSIFMIIRKRLRQCLVNVFGSDFVEMWTWSDPSWTTSRELQLYFEQSSVVNFVFDYEIIQRCRNLRSSVAVTIFFVAVWKTVRSYRCTRFVELGRCGIDPNFENARIYWVLGRWLNSRLWWVLMFVLFLWRQYTNSVLIKFPFGNEWVWSWSRINEYLFGKCNIKYTSIIWGNPNFLCSPSRSICSLNQEIEFTSHIWSYRNERKVLHTLPCGSSSLCSYFAYWIRSGRDVDGRSLKSDLISRSRNLGPYRSRW